MKHKANGNTYILANHSALMSEQKPLMEKSISDFAITQNLISLLLLLFPISLLCISLFSTLTFTMVDETDSSKTRLEKDLIIDVGKGNDLVAVTESQATELSNECSRSSSVYSVKEKAASMKSKSSIEMPLYQMMLHFRPSKGLKSTQSRYGGEADLVTWT
jgi:tRNA pseudouridine-54 N-methylase